MGDGSVGGLGGSQSVFSPGLGGGASPNPGGVGSGGGNPSVAGQMGETPPAVQTGAAEGGGAVSGGGSTGKLGQFLAWLDGVREKYPLLDKILGALSEALSKILGAAADRGVSELNRVVGIAVGAIAGSPPQEPSSSPVSNAPVAPPPVPE